MTRWILVLAPRPGTGDAASWFARAAELLTREMDRSTVMLTEDDRKGDGMLVWSLSSDSAGPPSELPAVRAALEHANTRLIDEVQVAPTAARYVPIVGPRAVRTLLMRVAPSATPEQIEGLENSLCAMPEHIDTIKSWTLSRLDPTHHTSGWTHLWEQEFTDVLGFRPYMAHAYHWTGVERWFDPEMPTCIVEEEAHYLCKSDTAVLSVR